MTTANRPSPLARMPLALRLLGAVLLCALVAGCVSLPDESSVQPARGVGPRSGQTVIHNMPLGPQPEATKTEIVAGYLQAMLAYPIAPSLVRQFLTPEAARTWVAGRELRVYENPSVVDGRAGTVRLKAQVLGSLDDRGSWVSASSSADALDLAVSLRKVGGQWRIGNPPDGTLIDTDFFDRYYHQYSLYYFDPSHTILTPDPVYLVLGTTRQTSTALVRRLLLGPTSSMGGVVSGEVPRGTALVHDVAVSDSGLAEVPLTSQISSMPPRALRFFAAQLAWTLRQERLGVRNVQITVAGRPARVPGLGVTFPVDNFQGYDPTIFAASATLFGLSTDGHLVAVSSDGVDAVAGRIGALQARAEYAAVNSVASLGALVIKDASTVMVGDIADSDEAMANAVWFHDGEGLLKPAWDVHNLLWLVDRPAGEAVVHVVRRVGSRVVDDVVDAPGIAGQDVQAFAVSRDGMRFAVVVGRGAAAQLLLAMVRRDPASRTYSLTSVRDVADPGFPLSSITAVAWDSPTTLMVLAQDEGSDPQPYQIAIDGSRVQPTTGFLPIRPEYLAAGADTDTSPVIGSADGRLYTRTPDQQWPQLTFGRRVFAPAYAG